MMNPSRKLAPALIACLAIALFAASPAAAAGGLTPSPASLDLGSQDIHNGNSPSQPTNLSNNTGGTLNVSSVAITGTNQADFSIPSNDCATVPDGGSCNVYVQFDPATPGVKSATLEVTDNLGTTSVPLTGTGQTGTLSGSSPTFNPQPFLYGSQSQNADITNASSYAATAMTASISGPDAAFFSIDYNGCNFTLYPSNNCSIGVRFSPIAPGTKTAQLELANDGTESPLIIPLSATALGGPVVVLSPPSHDFGTIAVGSSSPTQIFKLSNTGDFPLQIQQLLVLSGTPQIFPVSGDACSQQFVLPGGSCTFEVAFTPEKAGERDAAIYVISNQTGPAGTVPLTGVGVLRPEGSVSLSGPATAGRKIACKPRGYPQGTRFSFSWLKGSKLVRGETGSKLPLSDSDVGKRVRCRVQASNSVGTQTVTSPTSAAIGPQDLSRAGGSLVSQAVCRAVQAPRRLAAAGVGIAVNRGVPVTPWATLDLVSAGRSMQAWIDGRLVGSGVGRIAIYPRALNRFTDGVHTLKVRVGATRTTARIGLSPCQLTARLEGGPAAPSSLIISSAAGMKDPRVRLPGRLRLVTATARVGRVSVKVGGRPSQTFPLFGARTTSNGISVILGARSIRVRGLPAETGNVRFRFGAGVLNGSGGTIRASAFLRGTKARTGSRSPASWRR